MGYLLQPHTSAGRIPSDRGYRYYVDELMNPPAALKPDEANNARKRYGKGQRKSKRFAADLPHTFRHDLIHFRGDRSLDSSAQVCAVSISPSASSRHLLLVVLLSTGHVEHRLVEMIRASRKYPDDALELCQLSGDESRSGRTGTPGQPARCPAGISRLCRNAIQNLAGYKAGRNRPDGAACLYGRNQPASAAA